MALQVGEIFATLSLSTKAFNNSLASAKSRFASFGQSVMSASGLLGGAGSQVGILGEGLAGLTGISAGAAAGIGAVAAAVGGIGVMSARAYGEMQQMQMGFETLMGSAERAKLHLQELKDFAAKTPFDMPQLARASQQLQNVGYTAEQVLPMMQRIGDAAAATGGGDQAVSRIAMILTQIKAKQKVQAEEMMQLNEAGLSSWNLLADAIGITVPEAMERVAAGTISADGAIRAMLEGMDEKFGGLMQKQAETIPGLWSTLKDTLGEVARNIGAVLLPIITKGLKGVISFLEKIAGVWENFGKKGSGALEKVKPLLDPIIATVKNLWEGIKPVIIAIGKNLVTQFQILWKVAKPVLTLLFNAIKILSVPLKWILKLIGLLLEGMNALMAPLKRLLKIKDIKMPEAEPEEVATPKDTKPLELVGMPDSYFQEPRDAEEKAEKEAKKEAEKAEKEAQAKYKKDVATARQAAEQEARARDAALKQMQAAREKHLKALRAAEEKAEKERQDALKKALAAEEKAHQERLNFAGRVLAAWKESQNERVRVAEAAASRIKSISFGSLWESAMVAAGQAGMTPPKVSGEQQPTVSELRKIAATLLRQEQMERQQLQITADRLGTFA